MSYERDIPTIIKCQCGKGKIIKESESNEWGQIKEYGPYIDCEECRKIYDIKSEYYCPKPKHEFTIYYLVNKKTGKKIKIDI